MASPLPRKTERVLEVSWLGSADAPPPRSQIVSKRDLDELLDALHLHYSSQGRKPVLVDISIDDIGVLSIGLGGQLSVLNFMGPQGEPPYFSAAGDGGEQGLAAFYYMGTLSEFPADQLVKIGEARRASKYFADYGSLTRDIRWVEC